MNSIPIVFLILCGALCIFFSGYYLGFKDRERINKRDKKEKSK